MRIGGKRMFLWRAVDDEGEVIDLLVQRRRETIAAEELMRKRLKNDGFAAERAITNELRSRGVAFASPDRVLGDFSPIGPGQPLFAIGAKARRRKPNAIRAPVVPAEAPVLRRWPSGRRDCTSTKMARMPKLHVTAKFR